MPLLFQYGSNTNAERLASRIGDVDDRGRAETIEEYDLAFNVWSQSNGCAAGDLVPAPRTGHHAWGVLYRITEAGLIKLRKIEGKLYEEKTISVRDEAGEEVEAVTFLVIPAERRHGLWTSADYVGHIIRGLRAHDVPEEYVQRVIDIATETNQHATARAGEQIRLIAELRRDPSSDPFR
jgi:cation transport regulator ChaC